MNRQRAILLGLVLISSLIFQSCGSTAQTATPPAATTETSTTAASSGLTPQTATGNASPNQIRGDFKYTNDFVLETYYVEQAVALADMHGFVLRDKEWETPTESQVLGFMDVDYENNGGTYTIDLPVRPRGTFNDVDQNGNKDQGIQIFAVSYWPNYAGGPYSEGDDPTYGWPNYLASVITDSENDDEVTGGKLLLWAPDGQQQFPSGFGDDGLLFTTDDPVVSVPVGYTLVDLDQKPFAFSQTEEFSATLYEPQDLALKDYSADSYSVAFDKMFEVVRKEYAFNDIADKAPDWDTLYARLAPQVKEAETNQDPSEFYQALQEFTFAFKDGHVGLSGGEVADQIFYEAISSGYGMAIRILDDGSVMVVYVTDGGPAQAAGIEPGYLITGMNGMPVMDAIRQVKPLSAPFSTDFSELYQQARYLMRAPLGTEATFTYTNLKGKTGKAVLKAINETASYSYTSVYHGQDPNALPVEFKILDSGVGYIKVNSNYDDLNLEYRLFKRALDTFKNNSVTELIIDMRQNSGGSPLGFAGFFTDQEIPLGQLEYYSDKTGKFEPDGTREKVRPYQEQYSFDKMALLVGMACASACEIDAYGLSQVPGMMVMGETPSAGVEAEVARGQFNLPGGISLQVPTGRFTLSDGSIFLEGQGVQLTRKVAVTSENLLSGTDSVLSAAEQAVLEPAGMGVTPDGAPTIVARATTEKDILAGNLSALEDLAAESYSAVDLKPGETYTYTLKLSDSQPLAWIYGWCASNADTLKANWEFIQLAFMLDGSTVDTTNLAEFDYAPGSQQCKLVAYELTDWPGGEHHLQTQVTFTQKINDGTTNYPKGTFTYDYTVYVKP